MIAGVSSTCLPKTRRGGALRGLAAPAPLPEPDTQTYEAGVGFHLIFAHPWS
jgi:hypothetical protein